MGWKILGGLFIFYGIFMFILGFGTGTKDFIVAVFAAICLFAFGVYIIYRHTEQGKIKAEQKRQYKVKLAERKVVQQERARLTIPMLWHMDGLPLAEGARCSIFYNKDDGNNRLEISGGGQRFDLQIDKITDITVKTNVEIQKAYVSSIGGAVGGYMLFGGLGAMIGGRAKEKETKKLEHYLIITYRKDNQTAYVSFEASVQSKAEDFAKLVRENLTRGQVVTEL